MTHPVSIIMPIHNGTQFIRSAFETLAEQNYEPLEAIVVDDGSTDDTASLVKQYPNVRYIYQENAGPSVARNVGIKLATHEYITFLDVDDRYYPDKLAWQAQKLHENPDVDVVIGGIKHISADGSQFVFQGIDQDYDSLAFVNLGAAMFRRRVFDTVGLFAEDMRFSEDVDWFLRAMESDTRMVIYQKPALYYLLHDDSMTAQAGDARMRLSFLTALRRSTLRRRQPDGSLRPLPLWTDYMHDPAARARQIPAWKDEETLPDDSPDHPPS